MGRSLEKARITGTDLAERMGVGTKARLLEGVESRKDIRRLGGGDPAKATEMLKAIKDQDVAKDKLGRMRVDDIARIIDEPGMKELATRALHEMSTHKVTNILIELEKSNQQKAAHFLGGLSPETRAKVVMRIDGKTASGLVERTDLDVRTDIVGRLGSAKGAALLNEFRSPDKVFKTLQSIKNYEGVVAKLEASTAIGVLSKSGEMPSSGGLLEKLSTQAQVQVLTEVTMSKPELGAKLLTHMHPKDGANVVNLLDQKVASKLFEHLEPRVGGAIVSLLKPDTAVAFLKDVSATRASEIVIHVNQEKIRAQLGKKLEAIRSQKAVSEAKAIETMNYLESRKMIETAGDAANHLDTEKVARAFEKMRPEKVTTILQHMDVDKASAVLGVMKPEAIARFVQSADKNALVFLERMPPKQLVPLFEACVKNNPRQAGHLFMALKSEKGAEGITSRSRDIRVQVARSMDPEQLATMWKHMGKKNTAELFRLLPPKTFNRMVQTMEPQAIIDKTERMNSNTVVDLYLQLNKDPENSARQRKKALGVLATSFTVGMIDQIPIVGQHGGFGHIMENSHILIDSFLGAQTATLVVGNMGLRLAAIAKIPKRIPRIGGKALLDIPNLYQLANSVAWASVGYESQSIVMHFLH